ncbi:MAG: DUF2784 domain-containing protein [Candidatus Dormibacteraceae bacterium]
MAVCCLRAGVSHHMKWSLLADGLVAIHFAFTAFVILGGFLAWKWRRLMFAHLPALAWGIWVEVSATVCPLTPLENHLRHLAGESGYSGGFLAHYLTPVLYPPGLTSHIQWGLAAVLVALNAIAYGHLIRRSAALRTRIP